MSVDGEIPPKTLWNASLLAYGCESDTVTKGVQLSKFICLFHALAIIIVMHAFHRYT